MIEKRYLVKGEFGPTGHDVMERIYNAASATLALEEFKREIGEDSHLWKIIQSNTTVEELT